MASDSLAQQKALQHKYRQLTVVQRSLVQVLAVLYEPLSRANSFKCWSEAILPIAKRHSIKPLSQSQFSSQITKLIQQGILIQNTGEGPRCPKLLIDIGVRDAVITGTFEPIATAIAQLFPIRKRYVTHGPRQFNTEKTWRRELRIAIYRQDSAAIDTLLEDRRHAYWNSTLTFPEALRNMLNNPFDPDWVQQLTPEFGQLGLRLILENAAKHCSRADAAFKLTETIYNADQAQPELCLAYAEQLWLKGHLSEAQGVLTAMGDDRAHQAKRDALLGAMAFLTGHNDDALAYYRLSLKAAGKTQSAQVDWFETSAAVLYFFALLKAGSPVDHEEAKQYCLLLQKQPDHWLQGNMGPLLAVVQTQQGQLSKVLNAREQFSDYGVTSPGVAVLLEIYSLYWLDAKDLDRWLVPQLVHRYRDASQANYGWLALEIAELLVRLQADDIYQEMAEACGNKPVASPWPRCYSAKRPGNSPSAPWRISPRRSPPPPALPNPAFGWHGGYGLAP